MIYTLEQIANYVKPVAEKYEIPAVYVFGSYARGEATDESDIDLLVDTDGTGLKSAFQVGGLFNDFEEALPKEIDMITVKQLASGDMLTRTPKLAAAVTNEKVRVYERA